MNNTNCIEVYSANNILLFKLLLSNTAALPLPPGNNGNGNGNRNGSYKGKTTKGKSNNTNNGSEITEPQIRMLFRLMAQKGKSGDEANEELKAIFSVDTLKDISKHEASQMIQQLLEQIDGGN